MPSEAPSVIGWFVCKIQPHPWLQNTFLFFPMRGNQFECLGGNRCREENKTKPSPVHQQGLTNSPAFLKSYHLFSSSRVAFVAHLLFSFLPFCIIIIIIIIFQNNPPNSSFSQHLCFSQPRDSREKHNFPSQCKGGKKHWKTHLSVDSPDLSAFCPAEV